MHSLKHKTVLITGASSGIGKSCAEQFAAIGANLILTARRIERLEKMAADLQTEFSVKVLPIQMDVQNRVEVEAVIAGLEGDWQTIDVLVNNAGLATTSDFMQDGNPDDWDTMIQTNVNGLLYVTHAVLPNMVKRNAGHIVNIGSVAGHGYYPGGNVYCATKHAVKAISNNLRIDLLGKKVRVSEICPGAVHTEFSEVRWGDKAKSDAFYSTFDPLQAEDIADAVVYCVTRPLRVDVASMIVYPTDQASQNHIAKADAAQKTIFE